MSDKKEKEKPFDVEALNRLLSLFIGNHEQFRKDIDTIATLVGIQSEAITKIVQINKDLQKRVQELEKGKGHVAITTPTPKPELLN